MAATEYVITIPDGRFVSSILANRNPDNPVIYFTRFIYEAKVWKTLNAAEKARDRVRKKVGECTVWQIGTPMYGKTVLIES